MLINQIQDQEYNLTPEFNALITEVEPIYTEMMSAGQTYKHKQMLFVGKLEEYRRSFKERSDDRKAIDLLLSEAGIKSADKRDQLYAAYKGYLAIQGTEVDEYKEVAEQANPSQLRALGQGMSSDATTLYDAAKYLKKNKDLPTAQNLYKRNKGQIDSNFTVHRSLSVVPQTKASVNDVPNPTYQPVIAQEISTEQRLIDDEDMIYINSLSVARAYQCGCTSVIRAALQHATQVGAMSPELEQGMRVLAKELYSAVCRSEAKRQQAAAKTSILNHRS